MDQLALIDLPTVINVCKLFYNFMAKILYKYVLRQTKRDSLSYIGFSQGTTIAFAALSLLPDLHPKVNLFIAMAPSMKPKGKIPLLPNHIDKAQR
jgi:predicted esterase